MGYGDSKKKEPQNIPTSEADGQVGTGGEAVELMADTRMREGKNNHVISDNHVDLNIETDVDIECHVTEGPVNHIKESTPSGTSVASPNLDTPVANGIVVKNPEYTDTMSKSSERSSGSLIRTDEDDVTLTIPEEGRRNSFTPMAYTSESHAIPANTNQNSGYLKNRSQTLDSNFKYNKSVKTNFQETTPDRYLDESLNPFPAYYDEVPIESIPPPKPLRSSSTYNSRTLPPRAPKAPQITARPRTQQTPGYLSLDRRNLNAQRPPPRRQDSSQNFESELKQAIARVKTRSSLDTKYTGPDFDKRRPRSFSPAITNSSPSFDDELKKALFARRQSMNNFDYLYDTEKRSPEFDLRLTKSSEPTQEIKISEESAGSVVSASTRYEGSESEFSVNGDSGIVAGGDSVREREGKSRPGLDLQALGDHQHSLSESDLRVISEFSATMDRLKRGMRKEDAVKLERSITSIHKIVGGDRNASENEREKAISE